MLRKLIILSWLVCLVVARHGSNVRRDDRERARDHERPGNEEEERAHNRNILIQNQGKIVNNDRMERERPGDNLRILQDAGDQNQKIHAGGSRSYQNARDNNFWLQKLGYTQVIPKNNTDMETLLKEKFLLDVLRNINGELNNQNVIDMGKHLAVDKENFNGDLNGNIAYLLELLGAGKILEKTSEFDMFNSDHLRQTHGLYRLLLQAKDWKIFQQLLSFARQHFNGELVVNALLPAVRERADAHMLVIPSISEILPELIHEKEMVKQKGNPMTDSENINKGKAAKKTWQEWKQEKLQKQGAWTKYTDNSRQTKIKDQTVRPVDELETKAAYFTRDMDLNNFWHLLIMENWVEMGASLEQDHRRILKENSRQIDGQPRLVFVGRRRKTSEQNIMSVDDSEETVLPEKKHIELNNLRSTEEIELAAKKNSVNMAPEDRILRVGRRRQNIPEGNKLGNVGLGQQQIHESVSTEHIPRDNSMDDKVSDVSKGNRIQKSKIGERMDDIRKSVQGSFEENSTKRSDSVQQKLLFVGRRRKNLNTAEQLSSASEERVAGSEEEEIRNNRKKEGRSEAVNEGLIRIGRRRPYLSNLHENPEVTESMREKLQSGLKWVKEFLSDKSTEQNDGTIENNHRSSDLNKKTDVSEEELNSTEDSSRLEHTIRAIGDAVSFVKDNSKSLNERDESDSLNEEHKSESLNENRDRPDMSLLRVGRRRQSIMDRVSPSTEQPLRKQISNTEASQGSEEPQLGGFPGLIALISNTLKKEEELKRRSEQENLGLQDKGRQNLVASAEKQRRKNLSARGNDIVRNALKGVKSVLEAASEEEVRKRGFDGQILGAKRRRVPRSLQTQEPERCELRAGEVFLHNIQQMLARINIERGTLNPNSLKKTSIENRHNVDQLVNSLVAAELQYLRQHEEGALEPKNMRNIIGEILMGRRRHTGLSIYDIWSEIVALGSDQEDKKFLSLRNPLTPVMMQAILNVADSQSSNELGVPVLDGVSIDDVKVDKLVTFSDETRLNHKNFNIKISVTAAEAQNAMIRIFLGPKTLERQHLILLDAFETILKPGRSTMKRLSQDITWTSKDTTTYTQLYRDVMQAIAGKAKLQLNDLSPQGCRFPHRLLLPRGSTQGLPMQLLVVVTPQNIGGLRSALSPKHCPICSLGVSALKLNNVGLPYREDDMDGLSVPNVMLKDVLIYHVE